MGANRIELTLAVAGTAVSVDRLVDWGIARPAELWAYLDTGRRAGRVVEDTSAGLGHFSLAPALVGEVVDEATHEDLASLGARVELRPGMLATARQLVRDRRFRGAALLLGALMGHVPPDEFPGGDREWLATIVLHLRTFRRLELLTPPVVDRALAVAAREGDIVSEAMLQAAVGIRELHCGHQAEGRAAHARARAAADVAGGASRVEIYSYIAMGMVNQGLMREAVDAFEALLGDVPDDAVATGKVFFNDESPAAATQFVLLAHAYTAVGEGARGLELLQHLEQLARRVGRPALIAEVNGYLAWVYAHLGSTVAARYAEPAWAFYSETLIDQRYVWNGAVATTWSRTREGRLAEVGPVLEKGLQARAALGNPPLWDTFLFALDESLGPGIIDRLRDLGLDLVVEAERAAAFPSAYAAGAACRFLARHTGRAPASHDRDARITAHLERAIELLRQAGTDPELARALVDAARHHESLGDRERAASLRAEAQRLRAALPQEQLPLDTRADRLVPVIIELGRLSKLTGRSDGLWGEIAARLAAALGADRAALLELADDPRLLAVRGGDAAWRDELARVARPAEVELTDTGRGVRVVIPFAAANLGRRGLAIIENQLAPAVVSRQDLPLLAALGVQLGILFDNLLLWRELTSAREKLEQENRYFRESRPAERPGGAFVAHSPAMREVLAVIDRAAPTNSTVLLLGETGVGKDVLAREIHQRSARKTGPFIAVHVASMAPGLVASGLFGHERGAFTGATDQQKGRFELADGGTLFLDEIGELGLDDQVRLLRVLQDGTFERVGGSRPIRADFRLVAATNRDLQGQVKAGRFREDLFFRLEVVPIQVPPLRQRREEIPTLALMFMERFAREAGRTFEGISEADVERLSSYGWPGNVRELEHVIERAVVLSEGPRLRIPPLTGAAPVESGGGLVRAGEWPTLEEVERRYIATVLEHTRGKVSGDDGAARLLDLNPSTLNWRIDKLGLREVHQRIRAAEPAGGTKRG